MAEEKTSESQDSGDGDTFELALARCGVIFDWQDWVAQIKAMETPGSVNSVMLAQRSKNIVPKMDDVRLLIDAFNALSAESTTPETQAARGKFVASMKDFLRKWNEMIEAMDKGIVTSAFAIADISAIPAMPAIPRVAEDGGVDELSGSSGDNSPGAIVTEDKLILSSGASMPVPTVLQDAIDRLVGGIAGFITKVEDLILAIRNGGDKDKILRLVTFIVRSAHDTEASRGMNFFWDDEKKASWGTDIVKKTMSISQRLHDDAAPTEMLPELNELIDAAARIVRSKRR